MKLPMIPLALFLVSFALPAFDGGDGLQCAMACIEAVSEDISIALYYFPFTFSNLAMLVLPVMLLTRWKRRPVPRRAVAIQILLLLHVLSWPVFAIVDGELAAIQIGYWVWLASMLMMLVATTRRLRTVASLSEAQACC